MTSTGCEIERGVRGGERCVDVVGVAVSARVVPVAVVLNSGGSASVER